MSLADDFLADAQGQQAAPAKGSLAAQFLADASRQDAPKQEAPKSGGLLDQGIRLLGTATPTGLIRSLMTPEGRADLGNLAAGNVRGAGSIGATIVAPKDMAVDALAGKGLSLDSNRQRRAEMDQALASFGADPNSLAYGVGKVGMETAGTMGVGGAAANTVARVAPRIAEAAPALVDAVRTGGFSANGATGPTGLLIRGAGGAINGGLAAGLVDPQDAGAGAAIGATAPLAVKAVGMAGNAIRSSQEAGLADRVAAFQRNAPRNQTLAAAIEAGYQVPPAQVNPSMWNKTLESISGKQATQQLASVHNADVTDGLVRKALGMADDAPITRQALQSIRDDAGKAYQAIGDLPVRKAVSADSMFNRAASPEVNPRQMLEDLKQARNDSQGWYNSYNRSANPEELAKAKAAEGLATKLETGLEDYAKAQGREDLIPAYREARKRIAQTYTVERALNPASGSVDPKLFARLMQKGKPLSDGLETIGGFASSFPTVAKVPEKIGSPDTHNLKTVAALMLSGGGAAAAGPHGLVAGALPFVLPPMARARMFSEGAQKALVQSTPQASRMAQLANLMQNQALLEASLKAAPTLAASSGRP